MSQLIEQIRHEIVVPYGEIKSSINLKRPLAEINEKLTDKRVVFD